MHSEERLGKFIEAIRDARTAGPAETCRQAFDRLFPPEQRTPSYAEFETLWQHVAAEDAAKAVNDAKPAADQKPPKKIKPE